jgi:hypothetical protein
MNDLEREVTMQSFAQASNMFVQLDYTKEECKPQKRRCTITLGVLRTQSVIPISPAVAK